MNMNKDHLHRLQVIKAQNYIRENLSSKFTLDIISKRAGASPYHFIRLFFAVCGETPFQFIARERILRASKLLINTELPVVEIALSVGFETSSSFNKSFKKYVLLTPTKFRNLGEDQKTNFLYSLSMTPKSKENAMKLNMELSPSIVKRKKTTIYTCEEIGDDFKVIAPKAWEKFLPIFNAIDEDFNHSEFFGVGSMNKSESSTVCSYKAAFSLPTNPNFQIKELIKEELPDMKYACFLLTGSHENVWLAFEKAFEYIVKSDFELEDSPCLENYLDDPSITPQSELRTEILIPIK